jgi:hypothetical protein
VVRKYFKFQFIPSDGNGCRPYRKLFGQFAFYAFYVFYTFNASLKRRLADFSRKYPLLCRLERSTPEGSVTYVLDKSRLSIRLIPPYSEERKAAASAYAREHGFQVVTAEEKIA